MLPGARGTRSLDRGCVVLLGDSCRVFRFSTELGRRKKADVSLVSALLLAVFVVGMALAIQGRVQSARERVAATPRERDPRD